MRNAFSALAVVAVVLSAAAAHGQCRDSKLSVAVRELAIGSNGDFRYVAEASGGQPPYAYAWSGTVGSAEFKSDQRMTPIFLPYLDRYAEVVVTDRGGCTAKQAIGTPPPIAKGMCSTLSYSPIPTVGAIQSAGVQISYSGGGVQWRVALENRGLKGVALGLVQIKRPGDTVWNDVLKAAGPAEIFVPYHSGSPRLYDMQWCGASMSNPHPCLREVKPIDSAGVQASQITFPGDTYATIGVECRDAGLAALCKSNAFGPEFGASTRYREVVFWSVYDTGNYDYVVEYGFRNDGTITFRVGATGYNNPGQPFDPHMHDVLWRVDMDLFGAGGDKVHQIAHSEQAPNLFATDSASTYFTEGTLNWTADEFSALLIEGGVTNAHGNQIGYELTPWDRKGTARHHDWNETFTQTDFWVTRNNADEDGTGSTFPNYWGTSFVNPDSYLGQYVMTDWTLTPGSGPEFIFGMPKTDIVVWYRSAAHHDPKDEDRRSTDTSSSMSGLTLMHWQGFDLVPHNLFSYNPIMPANICYPN